MSSFFKEIYFFDSETEIEFFYIDTIVKKSKIENSLNLVIESTVKFAKSKLWKDIRSKKVFSEYPYELSLTYIQNLKELRNFKLISSALQTLEKEPAEIFKSKKVLIENKTQLNKFIHKLCYNDSYNQDTWQICMSISDLIQRYNQIWEGIF